MTHMYAMDPSYLHVNVRFCSSSVLSYSDLDIIICSSLGIKTSVDSDAEKAIVLYKV